MFTIIDALIPFITAHKIRIGTIDLSSAVSKLEGPWGIVIVVLLFSFSYFNPVFWPFWLIATWFASIGDRPWNHKTIGCASRGEYCDKTEGCSPEDLSRSERITPVMIHEKKNFFELLTDPAVMIGASSFAMIVLGICFTAVFFFAKSSSQSPQVTQ